MNFRFAQLRAVVRSTRIAATASALLMSAAPLFAAETSGKKNSPAAAKKPSAPLPASQWAEWNGVIRFRGQFEGNRYIKHYRDDGAQVTKSETLTTVAGSFVVDRPPHEGKWDVVSGNLEYSHDMIHSSFRYWDYGWNTSKGNFNGPDTDFSFSIDTKQGKWSFLTPPARVTQITYRTTLDSWKREFSGWKEEHTSDTHTTTGYNGFNLNAKLPPGKPVPLTGTFDRLRGELKDALVDEHLRVYLAPEFKDVDLVVEIEGLTAEGKPNSYEKWIPRGTVVGLAGSSLKVKARLQTPDGKATRERVDRFIFKLNDTSREPGVCLNFPHPPQTDRSFTAPDLRFGPAGTARDADRQEIELPPLLEKSGHAWAEARIECFDFGAWSSLSVTARLEDGRTITGHLKGNPSTIRMTLPKRTAGSCIADAWKEERGVTGSDLDDSEKLPNAGKAPGDGFTLYEEYRGFVEDGVHIEGDPAKIDFFIRNFIGADAAAGIMLFEQLTGAKLHTKLKDGEFVFEKRVMNVNHDRGPHHVDQHGVFLETQPGINGAEAKFTVDGVRGRPRLCKGILVQPHGANTSVTNHENLAPSEAIFAYDRAIAHELLHVVGVEHHGKGDGRADITFVFADDPRNKTGRPMFWIGDPAKRVVATVYDEVSGRDMAEIWAQKLVPAREAIRASEYPKLLARQKEMRSTRAGVASQFTVEQEAEMELNGELGIWTGGWSVGAEHGESSGDDNCIMRYYFAQIYEKKGAKNTFYFITNPHTERAGLGLCRSPVGTGVNAAQRQPQPRYGDAKAGWGPCANGIVFNDAVPPERSPK